MTCYYEQALLTGVKNGDVESVGDPGHSGATALAILLRPAAIVVAHAGDCRAVIGVAVKVDKSPGAAIDLKKVWAWDLNPNLTLTPTPTPTQQPQPLTPTLNPNPNPDPNPNPNPESNPH